MDYKRLAYLTIGTGRINAYNRIAINVRETPARAKA
jgi:hypothetical protein